MAKGTSKKKTLPEKSWSFLAYIAGDNNLSEAGLKDIREMCLAGASAKAHAAVQIDTAGEFDGVVRYEVSEPDATGVSHRVVIQRLPEQDSGAVETLRDFLEWGYARYPAKKRVVVVWNHGAGFRTRLPRRDIAYDDQSGGSLDMNELDAAFAAAGVHGANRVSVLGFDACLMNMLEIVHHLRERAEIVVGSEQTEPGDGWPYDDVLRLLHADKPPKDVAKGIVDAYIASYRSANVTDVTQSAVLTDATEDTVSLLSDLGAALVPVVAKQRAKLRETRLRVQSYEYADYVDLVHLCQLYASSISDAGVKRLARAVTASVGRAVIGNGSRGRGVANSRGLSVWFPAESGLYSGFRSKYVALDFYRKHRGWVDFLDRYHTGP